MMSEILQGNFLVQGSLTAFSGHIPPHPLLISDTSLSFWGGIDPLTGIVVDTSHPLRGICVTDTILCLPSGRGSCTASQVLLELILNHKAPAAFCFRDVDGLACIGAIVAQEVFVSNTDSITIEDHKGIRIPDMIHVGSEAYEKILALGRQETHGSILPNGDFLLGKADDVTEHRRKWDSDHPDGKQHSMRPFTDGEQSMLDTATTEAQRMAYRVLFRYAHLGLSDTSPPPEYLDIVQAHIDGCTYIGPGGLEFTQRLVQAKGQVQVFTTLNSVSADRRHHEMLGVPAEYAANSIALGDAYLALGCQPSFTCAPYLLSTEPALADQIAWGESNAVVYANSVLGAQTEKYADYLDICCAITGKVPAAGVHLAENRIPQVLLDATDMLDEILSEPEKANENADNNDTTTILNLEMLFPTLGHVCGTLSDGKVPVLVGFDKNEKWASIVTQDHLKAFCAAFGTTGTSPLVHIEGITPETKQNPNLAIYAKQNAPLKRVTWSHCEDTFALLNQAGNSGDESTHSNIDLVALGNPHLSVDECRNLVSLIKSMSSSSFPPTKHPNVRIMACLSREIHRQAEEEGHIQYLKDFGVEFINDTCWCMLLDEPVIPLDPDATVLTNSGKYAHYGPGLTNRNYRYGSTADCVHAAMTGVYPAATAVAKDVFSSLPSWLSVPKPPVGGAFQNQKRSFSTFTPSSRSPFTLTEPLLVNPLLAQSRAHKRLYESRRWVSRSVGGYALRILKGVAKIR